MKCSEGGRNMEWISVKVVWVIHEPESYYSDIKDIPQSDATAECDPEKNKRCRKTNCYINGGPCHLTSHEEYRKAC